MTDEDAAILTAYEKLPADEKEKLDFYADKFERVVNKVGHQSAILLLGHLGMWAVRNDVGIATQ